MNLKEIMLFLGINTLTPEMEQIILSQWQEIQKIAVKRHRAVPFSVSTPPFTLLGNDITEHLNGCKSGYLFVATLGSAVDTQIKRKQLSSMRDAVVFDAVASSFLESYCDSICEDLSAEKNITTRFSPGYGDFPIELQPLLLKAAGADKIGVSSLESFMMIPTKTVSAIIGIKEI